MNDWTEVILETNKMVKDQEKDIKDKIWTTRKGDRIDILAMHTEHIRNCIKFLEGNGKYEYFNKHIHYFKTRYIWIEIFKDELARRDKKANRIQFTSPHKKQSKNQYVLPHNKATYCFNCGSSEGEGNFCPYCGTDLRS
jgi:hypothetical protein